MSHVTRGSHFLTDRGRSILPVGAHFVPVEGPDWPWRVGPEAFDRAFSAMCSIGLDSVRIDVLWAAVEPEAGRYDDDHLKDLDRIVESAGRRGLWLHPALFIGGEVGDAFWDVPWRDGRHPHRDPGMLQLQRAHAAMLAERWRDTDTILAWDLTDEPPFWLFPHPTDDEAAAWTDDLVEAIRGADPYHLITIGTAGQEVGWGPFRADVVGGLLDFTCVHPYPIYQPELYPDSLLSPRMTHAGALETALAAGAGRPVMVHEYGASSAQFDPEEIAAYDRLLAWASLGRGAIGFFAWCWTDAEPAAYRRAPYSRQPHETQFGVTDWRGELRPRARVLGELAHTVRNLDLDGCASHGPTPPTAATVVPHEYVRPSDPQSYGLSDAPAGPYRPSESIWSPRRGGLLDVAPLVRSWLNAYVMSARADIPLSFVREPLDGPWPDVRLLVLPAPLATTTTSLWHVRTAYWSGATEFFARGGVLYLSCSADVAIPYMEEIAGCRLAGRTPGDRRGHLRFLAPWGPFRTGDEFSLPQGDGTLATRGVRLTGATGRVIAVDGDNSPALVVSRRGAGHAVVCAFPVELLAAAGADAHGPRDKSWGLYAGLADLAGARGEAAAGHPDVTAGTLRGPHGRVITLTNHSSASLEVEVRIPEGARDAARVGTRTRTPVETNNGHAAVTLDPYGAVVLTCAVDG